MQKKILYVVGDLDIGGTENHISQILPHLKNSGLEPSVYTLTHKGVLASQLEMQGIRVLEPPYVSRLRMLPVIIRKPLIAIVSLATLWWLLVRTRPDIVHFFLPAAYILGGICSLFAPVAKRVMSRRSLNIYSDARPVIRLVERFLHKRMTCLTGNSRAVIEQLREESGDTEKIRLIYNGVNLDLFEKTSGDMHIRKEQGVPEDNILITMVANIIPYKGHRDLVKAVHLMTGKTTREFTVFCVGRDSGIVTELKAFAEYLSVAKKIHWLGERKDVTEILLESDIGVLSSHEEGFSNSVLEKMAASLPLVVTDVGGNSEAVIDGECGLVVPSRNPEILAEALIEFIEDEDKRKKYGQAARKRVESNFSMQRCVENYLDMYSSL